VRSPIFDTLWGDVWPGVQARALHNRLATRWLGREQELLAAREEAVVALRRAEEADDPEEMIHLAGMGVGRIRALVPAGRIVQDTVAEATRLLRELGGPGLA
jgi:nitronate monooxygenase